ncbi:hypothetical protein IMCC26207_109473 [Actinobacteria bacterium IMCC26207]|nr:hypothetical protein IMCC26207_109473 [Actinobacteria bacterium IMCC26207]
MLSVVPGVYLGTAFRHKPVLKVCSNLDYLHISGNESTKKSLTCQPYQASRACDPNG